MGLLTRDAILAALDLPTETVAVPEWGGEVRVRGMTGTERDAFEMETFSSNGKNKEANWANMRARALARGIVDESGDRIFTDADIALLGSKSAAAMDRVFEVFQRLNGLRSSDLDTLAKNSESDPPDASSSASPKNSAA